MYYSIIAVYYIICTYGIFSFSINTRTLSNNILATCFGIDGRFIFISLCYLVFAAQVKIRLRSIKYFCFINTVKNHQNFPYHSLISLSLSQSRSFDSLKSGSTTKSSLSLKNLRLNHLLLTIILLDFH